VRLGVGAAVDGGTMLVVQSELPGVGQSLASLRSAGMDADVLPGNGFRSAQRSRHGRDGWNAPAGCAVAVARSKKW
jgi:hypothetical protein